MGRVKVGVIGCGTIAQIMHFPYLQELEELYEIRAVCDISRKLTDKIGEIYNIRERYTDYRKLMAESDIDAVVISTPLNHSEIAIEAARSGKHILTEKPMCVSMKAADDMIETAEKNGVKLMVGHMRLFDPGFQYVQKIIKGMKNISLIRQHTSRGPGVPLPETYTLYRFDDIPDEEKKKSEKFIEEEKKNLGDLPGEVKNLYLSLIGGTIHDVYVLRSLFGSPKRVLFTKAWGPNCLISVLEYSDMLKCVYTTGPWDMEVNDFDIGFIVYGKEKVVDFKFALDSYLKNDPASAIIKEMEDGVFVEKNVRVSFEEAFREELKHFHSCIVEDKEPLISGRDAKKDLELVLEIAKGITFSKT